MHRDALAILRQFAKGAYTNQPTDPNYGDHWNVAATPPHEQVAKTIPATAIRHTPFGKVKQQVNIRVGTEAVYVDTSRVEAVGPIARIAQLALKQADLLNPQTVPISQVSNPTQPFTVPGAVGDLEVRPRPQAFVGRPSELPPREQVVHLWRLLRGR